MSGREPEPGHLSVLVQRVRDDEMRLGYVTKEHLIDVCEFILSWPGRYGREEYCEVMKILGFYHLGKLANIHSYRSTCWRLINAERAKPYIGRCRRCGLPISNPISVMVGHGPVCRKKLGIILNKEERLRQIDEILVQNGRPREGRPSETSGAV